jgi:predicted Zn finger-like uncharacterized protein
MSLKTRCPACETIFKIVPDQLKVSSGWVRCGRCAEVFDAAAHAASSSSFGNWPQPAPAVAVPPNVVPSPVLPITPIAPITTIAPAVVISPKKIEAPRDVQPSIEAKDSTQDLSFVRIAKNKAFWQRTAVVRSLRAVCVGLVGLLFFQVVFSQRHHLAASNPALKSSFESLCVSLGCVIEPFKNIDAFKIDSSSFQKSQITSADTAQAETFALKLTIRNSSDLAVAMPAVELTLTESSDKPVLRRVLLAKDLGFSDVTLAANGEWNGAMSVVVSPNPAMPPITGYRVLLFYP